MPLTQPHRWRRQPQLPVIAEEYRDGLLDYAFQTRSLLDGTAWTTFGTAPSNIPTPIGMGVDTTGASGGAYRTFSGLVSTSVQAHLIVVLTSSVDGAYSGLLSIANLSSTGFLALQRNGSNNQWDLRTNDGANVAASGDDISGPGPKTILLQSPAGGGSYAYLNGRLWLSHASTPNAQSAPRIILFGERNAVSGYCPRGFCALRISWWGRGFSEGEAQALTDNPWRIFATSRRRVYGFEVAASGAIAGTCDLGFGAGSSMLRGTGALAGAAAETFGHGSSTLTATGALAGAAANTFGHGSSALTGAGLLAGTMTLTFGHGSSALVGAGALAGTVANVFGEGSSTLINGAAGAATGTIALLFGAGSSALTASGALAGAAANVFGAGSSTLRGAGALAGSAAQVFGGSGTLSLPSGAVAGTVTMTFADGSSLVTGAGRLAGTSVMVFTASMTVAGPAGTFTPTPRILFAPSRTRRFDAPARSTTFRKAK